MLFKFVGDPKHGGEGPAQVLVCGHTFVKGGPAVTVTDEAHCAKLAHNPHFVAVATATTPELDAETPAKVTHGSHHEGGVAHADSGVARSPSSGRDRHR